MDKLGGGGTGEGMGARGDGGTRRWAPGVGHQGDGHTRGWGTRGGALGGMGALRWGMGTSGARRPPQAISHAPREGWLCWGCTKAWPLPNKTGKRQSHHDEESLSIICGISLILKNRTHFSKKENKAKDTVKGKGRLSEGRRAE